MHYHEAKEKLNVGDYVYICDYRFNNIDEKPIRHIKPQRVLVCSNDDLPKNKTVYYSEHHFKPIGAKGKPTSQIISPYDNTGYRAYTGVSLNIFFDERKCIQHYKKQCKEIVARIEKAKVDKIEYYNAKIIEINEELNAL